MRIALLPALVAILVIANGAWANTYDNVDYRFRVHWYRAADRGQVRAAAHPAELQRLASTQPPSVDQVDMLSGASGARQGACPRAWRHG
jgi:hypothetical protein